VENAPPYEALSYTWNDYDRKSLILNGSPLKTTGNIASAMKQLQQPEPQRLRIDALCINQDDKEEKARQVQQMRNIYSKTDTVIMWLGESFTARHLAQTISGSDDEYLDVLDSARERPVILFDNDENSLRAWMVPAICVIDHMVHMWASHCPDCLTNVPRAPLSLNANSTLGILREHGDHYLRNTVPSGDGNRNTIKSLVMQFWKGIVQRAGKELQYSCDAPPEMAIQSSKMYAWELMDFIRGDQSLRKQIDFFSNWKPFTKDALVLVGKTFGDVIRPAPGISVCQQWNPVPSQRMYLTSTIDCFTNIVIQAWWTPRDS
jgi:hypothetical protein